MRNNTKIIEVEAEIEIEEVIEEVVEIGGQDQIPMIDPAHITDQRAERDPTIEIDAVETGIEIKIHETKEEFRHQIFKFKLIL